MSIIDDTYNRFCRHGIHRWAETPCPDCREQVAEMPDLAQVPVFVEDDEDIEDVRRQRDRYRRQRNEWRDRYIALAKAVSQSPTHPEEPR